MKHVLAAGAAIVLTSTGAGSAAAQSNPDWTGFSFGIVGGVLSTDDDEDEVLLFDRNLDGTFGETVTTVPGANAFSPGFCGGSPNGTSAGGGCDDDKEGVEAAIRLGYDYQWGAIVVGAVGEFAGSNAEDSVTGFTTTPASYTFKRHLQSVAALRLRLGYAVGPALIYGTGGVARGKIDNRFFSSNGVNQFTTTSDDEQDLDGWQAGGGLEYRLTPRLSVIGEYIYTSLDVEDDFVVRFGRGAAPATNPFILPPNTTGTDTMRSSDEFNTHSFRIGMAYRF
ncbi:outer membrane protein [Brevundimonas sp.]|uniref:outer membrane protein n=1 Tax=Brevundimonas sp. TaxID=1871086 RepID=UPI00272FAF6B|nr:outer membrane beta-barrel protein [Brevundimonas sp.]MDP1913750.1 outer membrane beta-barrel protein [Brevundimonas sp.]